jgi:hypothetical protein
MWNALKAGVSAIGAAGAECVAAIAKQDAESKLRHAAGEGNIGDITNFFALQDYYTSWALDANSKDSDGQTALHFAAQNGHTAAIEYLLDHRASLDEKENQGCAELMVHARTQVALRGLFGRQSVWQEGGAKLCSGCGSRGRDHVPPRSQSFAQSAR